MTSRSDSTIGTPAYSASPESRSQSTVSSISANEHEAFSIPSVAMEPIAIIGMSLKLPGDAVTADAFWEMMIDGKCTASAFPADRFNHESYLSTDSAALGTIRPAKAHFLKEDLSVFDAAFFGLSDSEANAMDPQQRGLMETTFQALENAGIPIESVKGTDTSVHTGCFTADYTLQMAKDPETIPKYAGTGMAATLLSNRISTFFDLKGPSVSIDTACSSSLVALDQACQCLRLGQTSMGIVAGCNLVFGPDFNIALSNMGFLSPDGICHSFDHRANGYARGEGFGVIIIKRLSDAVQAGDSIRAVIRATGTNQAGHTLLAQPSKEAQAQLMADVYRQAGLDPTETRYIEAHGTGTAIGDPLEAMAIGSVFALNRTELRPLYVGSLKANFGHLEGAAGIAGIMKSVLLLERAIIPPVAGLEKINPDIDAEFLKIKFPMQPTPWPERGLRRISVNSFGFGGTNAHAILDDAYHFMKVHGIHGNHCTKVLPPYGYRSKDMQNSSGSDSHPALETVRYSQPAVMVWSATEKDGLSRMTSGFQKWFAEAPGELTTSEYISSLVYTLLQRRTLFSWRSFAVVDPLDRLQNVDVSMPIQARPSSELSLAFVFTGQGAQWCGMARELFIYEVFRRSISDAMSYLRSLGCQWHLAGALTGDLEPATLLDEPGYAQPTCTILQVALVDLLASANVLPSVVLGHSSGEIAAAYACGAISRESAWKIAYYRGVCSNKVAASPTTQGTMIAVGLPEHDARRYIDLVNNELGQNGRLAVACINSPANVTVSGDRTHIQALASKLQEQSVFARILRVTVAYHGPHMDLVSKEYRDLAGQIAPGSAVLGRHVNMVSSVTGERISFAELREPAYWVRNMVSQVKFMQAIQRACSEIKRKIPNKLDLSHLNELWATDVLEIGPHATLSGPIRESLQSTSHGKDVKYQATLMRKKHSGQTILTAAAQLHCRGYPVHLSKLNTQPGNSDTKPACLPNLPLYSFNHSRSFWFESRLSRGVRFRKTGRNPFLGSPVPDWNPADARWRHILRLSDSPWIADHTIHSSVLFPAAGMLVMVIEAAAQLAGTTNVSAFEIRDANIRAPLVLLPDSDGIEVQLQMLLRAPPSDRQQPQYDFFLRTHQTDWTEVFQGSVRIVLENSSPNPVDGGNEELHLSNRAIKQFEQVVSQCTATQLDRSDLYARLKASGYNFGPRFLRIQQTSLSTSEDAMSKVDILDAEQMESATVVHPATLDGVLQTMLAPLLGGEDGPAAATVLPTRVGKLRISRSGLLRKDAETVDVAAKTSRIGRRMTKSNLVALSGDKGLKIHLEDMECTSVLERTDMSLTSSNKSQQTCWSIVYKPDVERIEPSDLRRYLIPKEETQPNELQVMRKLDLELDALLKATQFHLAESGESQYPGHLQYYQQWMSKQLAHTAGDLPQPIEVSYQVDVLERFYNSCNDQQKKIIGIYWHTAQRFVDILTGKLDPLQYLFEGSYLSNYYEKMLEYAGYTKSLNSYLELLAHKNPSMKILEVGAGTGGATKHVLNTLTQEGSSGQLARYSEYVFTDISPSFFENAAQILNNPPSISYKTLDIESDPLSQGFEEETYDLIIAASVLHIAGSLSNALEHINRLLRPGGTLILFEPTHPDTTHTGFLFGLLPTWWQSKDSSRQNRLSPCLSDEEWDTALAESGFSGVNQVFHDIQDEQARTTSLIISIKRIDTVVELDDSLRTALFIAPFAKDGLVVEVCRAHLRNADISIKYVDCQLPASIVESPDSLLIILDNLESPLLHSLDEGQFSNLRQTLTQARHVLWLSYGTEDPATYPARGTVHGFARTLRSENQAMNLAVFEASTLSLTESNGRLLRKVIDQSLLKSLDDFEPDFAVQDGLLTIPRVVEDIKLNRSISEEALPLVQQDVRFGDGNIQLNIRIPGLLDSLCFVQTSPFPSGLAPNEVEVRVKAVGVNFRDCLVALGRIPDDDFRGECAGIVERVGSSCSLRPGDRVTLFGVECYRGVVRCDEVKVAQIPDDVSYAEAAKLPINFITSYLALVQVARIEEGETVLIHCGAGGTGQAAIQIAQCYGAEVFTTVGSKHKKSLLMSLYGIPEDHIFYSRDTSFAQGIKSSTNGQGVDVILNSLAGDEFRASWECIAPYGRFLEIGKRDIYQHENLPMYQFARNVSFSAVDVSILDDRPKLIKKLLNAVVGLLREKKIRGASPLKTFSVHEVEDAFRYLQSGENAGAIAIEVDHDVIVQALIPPKPSACFRPDATYIIAGGLGGQGRSIAKWMVTKGAKSLLILSRQGSAAKGSEEFLTEISGDGVHVELACCDITQSSSLRQVIADTALRMPPIKGCIQAAMVLQDSLFDTMTHDEWVSATRPKIEGSWNLHEQLPSDLDFFILFASGGGIIGSSGQANYAAGNTYQDALAAYRISIGQKAVALDLPLMKEEGYFTNNEEVLKRYISTKNLTLMTQSELFAILEHFCAPNLPVVELRSQVVMGLSLPAELRRQGLDEPSWMGQPMFSHLHQIHPYENDTDTLDPSNQTRQDDVLSSLSRSTTRAEAASIVAQAIQDKFSRILSRPAEDIDTGMPIGDHGVDSLVAVELRNWFSKTLKADVPVFEILGGATIDALGTSVAEKLGFGA